MPRPGKCRKVCCLPVNLGFTPVTGSRKLPAIVLTADEHEALRLIDKKGFSQGESSTYMNVARITDLYDGTKKIADSLVDGLPLRIEDGNYRLCDGEEEGYGCGGCRKHRRRCRMMEQGENE